MAKLRPSEKIVTPSKLRWIAIGLVVATMILAASCGSTTTTLNDTNNSTQASTAPATTTTNSGTTATTTNTTTTNGGTPAVTATSSKYEVVGKVQSGAKLVLNVYTKEKTAAGLIAINDELLKNNLASNDTLLYNFFNDKELAKTYFDKIGTASGAEANAMTAHYTAYLRYSTAGVKEFTQNQNGSWVVIKSY